MNKLILALIALVSVSACTSKMKERTGIANQAPDEHKVIKGKPLEIPPHYELKEPV